MCGDSPSTSGQEAMYGKMADIAGQQWDFYKEFYQPFEGALINEAKNAGSAADFQRAASEAKTDVSTAYANARAGTNRELMSMGVNPNSGKFISANRGMDIKQAAAEAGGQNFARKQVRDEAWAKKAGMLSMGKGMPAQAQSGLGSAAGGLANIANAKAQQESQEMSGWGSAVGAGIGLMMMSSHEFKEGFENINKESILDGLISLPVEKWKYKDGIADQAVHIGTYAEDFNQVFGLQPSKFINVADVCGVLLAAMQALAAKVAVLEGRA